MNSLYCDLLIRIKNASLAKRKVLDAIDSSFSQDICNILKKHGFISDFSADSQNHLLTISSPNVKGIDILSKPGRRLYVKSSKIPWGKSPKSLIIISTSNGLLSQKEAVAKKIGGELIAQVW